MKEEYLTWIGIALLVFGGVFLLINVQDMFQLRMTKTASVANQQANAPQITWKRTKGPGTLSMLLSTVTPGEKVNFCGKAKVSSNSERPIYEGHLDFEAYRGVTDIRSEDCWGKRMYCDYNDACDSSDLIDSRGFDVGRVNPGEETQEKCFTIEPEAKDLVLGETYHTILYIYDSSYTLDKCSSKPGNAPTLAFDYWKWDYKDQKPDVEIVKTALSVTALGAGASLLLFPRF